MHAALRSLEFAIVVGIALLSAYWIVHVRW